MENAKKRHLKTVCLMLSLLIMYGSAQAAILPLSATEGITVNAVENDSLIINLQSVTTSGSTNAYVTAAFSNEYSELTRIADAGVMVNGSKLNYNSSYSYISYANSGDCIVSGNTIQFYTSSLSEGENTVTFTNPDGEDVSVRLNMSKSGDYWSGYSYTVDVLDDEQETDNDAEAGSVIDLKTVAADASTSAYTVATFGNEYSDLTRIANAGVFVNGTKLNYNSSYSSLYYVNSGDCIVTGNTIQFHSNLLTEGENTVTFSNPDGGENKVVRLKMSKVEVPPKYWYESTSYDYVIEVIEDEPQAEAFTVTWKNGNTILETDTEVEKDSTPVYDGAEPVKDADDEFVYTFAGWSAAEDGEALAGLPAVTANVTYYAVFTKSEKPQTEQQIYVRLVGSFEHKIVGQQDDVDVVSSATTGGSSYISSSSSAHVEYALADKGTTLEDIPEEAWDKPDYFKNGDLLQVDGARSKIIISPECEGVYGEINQFSGDLFLRGVPKNAGTYKVSVYLATDKGNATSNEVDTKVEAKEPTHQKTGNVEYYIGSDGKYYLSNGEDYVEVTKEEVEIAAIPCKVTITSATGGSIRVLADYDDENGGRQIYSGTEVPYGTELYVIREVNTGFTLENGKSYETVTLTVEDDIEISLNAVKKTYKLDVTAENGSYTTNAADLSAIPYGTKVTLKAGKAENGYEFIGWYQTNGKQLTANISYTATITSDYAIEARYQVTGGVVSFMANNAVVKTVTVEAGSFTDSDFPSDPSAYQGYEFSKWSKTSDEINASLENGGNVNVEAVYIPVKQIYTISVYNGNSETAEEISCTESTVITRRAEAVEGKYFAYWTLNGEILTYNKTASYRAAENGILTAVYTEEAVKVNATATIRKANYNSDNKKLTINAYLTIPDGCKITSAGLVAASSDKYNELTDELTWDNAEYKKSLASAVGKSAPVNYTWNKSNVNPGDVWYARAHIAYTDADGEEYHIYGDLMTITAGTDYDILEKGTATIRKTAYNASTKKATFNAYLTVPDNGVVVNAGLVAASDKTFDPAASVLTSSNAEYTKTLASAAGRSAPVSYTWNKSKVNSGDVWYARAYLVYTLEGVQHTVYGDLTTLTAE